MHICDWHMCIQTYSCREYVEVREVMRIVIFPRSALHHLVVEVDCDSPDILVAADRE